MIGTHSILCSNTIQNRENLHVAFLDPAKLVCKIGSMALSEAQNCHVGCAEVVSRNWSDHRLCDEYIRTQNPDCFTALFQKHHAAVFQFILRGIRDYHSAEDISQQVWRSVSEKLERFRWERDDAFVAWLYTIARNMFLNYIRQQRNRGGHRSRTIECMDVMSNVEAPFTRMMRYEEQRRIEDAINSLPDGQREVVTLRFLQGIEPNQVAAKLHISVNAVGLRVIRARETLARALH